MAIVVAPIDVIFGNMKCPNNGGTLLTEPFLELTARSLGLGIVELAYGNPPPDRGSAYFGTICATSYTVDIVGTIPSATGDYRVAIVVNGTEVKAWEHTFTPGEPDVIPFDESYTGSLTQKACGNTIEIEAIENLSPGDTIGDVGVTATITAS